ncbi:MAG: hypothetical protein WCW67_07250, partial [Candidatus Margulisiibacteriota bacterium]
TPSRPGEAGRLLNEVAALPVTEKLREIQAEAWVWLGKIALAQADKEQDRERKEAILVAAAGQLNGVFGLAETGRPLLRGTSLSSALQTVGDILAAQKNFTDAGLFYRLAIGEKTDLSADELTRFPALRELFTVKQGAAAAPFAELLTLEDLKGVFGRNYFALSGLGDILNWQGRYADSLPYYQRVTPDAVAYPKAQLGMLEAGMRTDETYSPRQIAALEGKAKAIFASEPPASSLILRALDDLTEAYRTDEDLQERIVFIGQELLGGETPELTKVETEVNGNRKAMREMLAPIDRPNLEPRVKANLWLNMAEGLLWRQRFDEAIDLPVPTEVKTVIANRDIYRVRFNLIQVEAKMRRDFGAKPFLDFLGASLENSEAIRIALREKDPDLAARIILDLSEAYVVEESWPQAVAATNVKAALLKQVETLFESRRLGYRRLELGLAYQRVEANIGGKEFAQAEKDALAIPALTSAIRRDDPHLAYVANRGDAQSLVFLGDLYSYRWIGENFEASRDRYNDALKKVKDDNTKDSRLLRAKIQYGLGQVYNFGRPIMDYPTAKQNYEHALRTLDTLPQRSIPKLELLAKIYLGLATLEQKENNQAAMREYLEKARFYLDQIRRPLKEIALSLRRMENSVLAPNVSVAATHFEETSGNYASREDRLATRFALPFLRDQYIPSLSYFADNRTSSQGNRSLGAAYLGLRANPDLPWVRRTMTFDLNYRFLQSGAQDPHSSAPKPIFNRQPNVEGSVQLFTRYALGTASHSRDFNNSDLNTTYLSLGLNSAGFFPRWPVQVQANGFYSNYNFLSDGRFPARQDAGLDLKIKGDLAEATPAVSHNTLSAELGLGFVFYQHERVPGGGANGKDLDISRGLFNVGNDRSEGTPDYLRGGSGSNPFWGPVPLRANLALKWNPGTIGVFQLWGGLNYQATDQFSYRSTNVGLSADFAQFLHF